MESQFLGWLRSRLPESPWLRLGPGDDAGVLRLGKTAEAVVTSDLLTDQVDFRLGHDDPRRIGRKALAVNLSDLAAMAAEPRAAVISLALPRDGALDLACSLYEGLLPLAAQFGVAIAGGDTNTWDGGLVISVTLIGEPGPGGLLLRSGAKAGDAILVTGSFGGSIHGKQFDFGPRVAEALLLMQRYGIHAGIDCSDGLAHDVWQVAEASGCGAEIELANVPIAPAAKVGSACRAVPSAEPQQRSRPAGETYKNLTPLDHALRDGEDFELILAVEPSEAARLLQDQPLGIPLTRIGQFCAEPGLWQIDGTSRSPLKPIGYEH
ncbi:MAG: thiamine-phosphate kinase [Planctomycetia bacterium]|nr:thiamine-phosphate kinase [Planctomycetia bacterium]